MNQHDVTPLDLSSLHDAELESLVIDRSNARVEIVYTKVDGSTVRLKFEGVLTLRTSGFQFQNVVHGVVLSSIVRIGDSNIDRIARWVCSVDDGKLLIEPAKLNEFIRRISDNKLILFHADPSWGAEIGILCEKITLG